MGYFSVTDAVTVSVVSHGQKNLVDALLGDLALCPEVARVSLTHNIPEPDFVVPDALRERVKVTVNDAPRGFGANHNAALLDAPSPWVCILNPDIRFTENPFPSLLACLRDTGAVLAAPQVLNPTMRQEDSARYFPTLFGLLLKAVGRSTGRFPVSHTAPSSPDWVAGMFMLIRTDVFSRLEGFDEGFFLYYEDVDLCARLRKSGLDLRWCPSATVIHDARRESRRKLRYMWWHAQSMLRFFLKQSYRKLQARVI